MHYLPEVVIVNNLEFDHADIFENLDAIKLSFRRLIRIVPRNGLIIANSDDVNVQDVLSEAFAPVIRVGMCKGSDIQIANCNETGERSAFTLRLDCRSLPFEWKLVGEFNARNAAMATVAAQHVGIEDTKIQEAVAAFQGVKRRQEVRAVVNGITIIDDFGHHPTAIRETLAALRRKHAGARLWAFFEPRSNTTRRAVFQKELPEALALADGVFVSQVARIEQIPPADRLNPSKVMEDIRAKGREAYYLSNVEEIVASAVTRLRRGDVAVIFSNGDFGGIHEKLIKALK